MIRFALIPILVLSISAAGAAPEDAGDKPQSAPAAVHTYQDVLAVLPAELHVRRAREWPDCYKGVANAILKKKLVDTATPAEMTVKVTGVDYWDQMVLWAELPSDEGYHIRIFAAVLDHEVMPRLAALHPGDSIVLSGVLDHAFFEQLWNTPSLSLTLKDTQFRKLPMPDEPAPDPAPLRDVEMVSAVYGAGGQFADVSAELRRLLSEPGAAFPAKPYWLGADPAPGACKSLVMVTQSRGVRRVTAVAEGDQVCAELLRR